MRTLESGRDTRAKTRAGFADRSLPRGETKTVRPVCRRPGDDGFTMAESLIAAAILLFALTAMFGLASANSQMAGGSRGRAILTNLVSAKIDIYRAYTLGELDSLGGTIPDVETTEVAGWTITLTTTSVVSTAYPNTRDVTIAATATHSVFPQASYSVTAAIRGVEPPVSSGDTSGPMLGRVPAGNPAADRDHRDLWARDDRGCLAGGAEGRFIPVRHG